MPALSGRIDPQHGATVFVTISQTPEYVDALKRAGRMPSMPVSVLGILDTGASGSALDSQIIARMSLLYRDNVAIHTPSSGPNLIFRDQFDATLALGDSGSPPLAVTVQVIECEFASRGFFALIGRDILDRCILTYDGPAQTFTLSW